MSKRRNWAVAVLAMVSLCSIGVTAVSAGASPSSRIWRSHSTSGGAAIGQPHALVAPLNMSTLTISDDTTGVNTFVASSPGSVSFNLGCATGPSSFCVTFGGGGQVQVFATAPLQAGNSYSTPSTSISVIAGNSRCGMNVTESAGIQLDQFTPQGSGAPSALALQFACDNGTTTYSGTVAYDILPTTPGQGYYLYGNDGSLAGFGNDSYLNYLGDLTQTNLNAPINGMAITPDGAGYWMAASDGGIFAYGDAGFYGSHGGSHLNQPIVGMTSTPDGGGYWLVASDGGIFTYGDAGFYGSTGVRISTSPSWA